MKARALIAAVVVAVGLGTIAEAAGDKTFIRTSKGKATVKPERVFVSTGTSFFYRAKDLGPWRGWGDRKAKARGILVYSYLDQAQRSEIRGPGEVTVSRINRRCKTQRRYRKIRFDFDSEPGATVFTLDCRGFGKIR